MLYWSVDLLARAVLSSQGSYFRARDELPLLIARIPEGHPARPRLSELRRAIWPVNAFTYPPVAGRPAHPPGTAEILGYIHDAEQAIADLKPHLGMEPLAPRL
jgi:hypothetical protein